jgi:valyl-tRNA synthetase
MMGGFILSEDGTPMHASLGNVIDPLKLIDEYGTDAFRCYAASCALGEDNAFRNKDVVRGTRLLRKLWNVEKFISNIIKNDAKPEKPELIDIDRWILTKYSKLVKKCTELMDVFDYSPAMKEIEYFLWHELADHYIEMAKSSIYKNENVESISYTIYTLGLGILKLFAPFFPHITEEIYHQCYKKFEGCTSVHVSPWPEMILIDNEAEKAGEYVKDYISWVRSWKSAQGMALNASMQSSATYSTKSIISKIKPSGSIIKSTLNYPDDHEFIVGKPDVEEKITSVKPVHSKIGPLFKKESGKLTKWIGEHQDELIKTIEEHGDVRWSEIPIVDKQTSDEPLIKNGYIQVKKETKVKGKKDKGVLQFDDFYIEVPGDMIK